MEETTSRKRNREKGTEKALSVGDAGEVDRLAIPQVHFEASEDVEEGKGKGGGEKGGGAKSGCGGNVVMFLHFNGKRARGGEGRGERERGKAGQAHQEGKEQGADQGAEARAETEGEGSEGEGNPVGP